ncbi:SCO1431 family membrane protein [Streptomyces sp. Z26]|uniref:SCO1431 family membrane protein n=1 Tax=Streptomyces TaxID=1883 RepID=UPI000EF16C79|nr:SCO1431 family membrane protein [Streptomyces sp. Z26]RLL68556.1 SCO1431 family membrane protein [Streptomyces sp. Z26]
MTHALATRLTAPFSRAALSRTSLSRTGGPDDDGFQDLLEHALGWTLLVLVAVLVTRLGLM